MEWVETTGSTLEEASERALDELGVDEHDAEFEILEQPKLGLFGRVRVEARVRARVRPTTPRAKEDRRDRRRRGRRDQNGDGVDAPTAGGDEGDGTSSGPGSPAPTDSGSDRAEGGSASERDAFVGIPEATEAAAPRGRSHDAEEDAGAASRSRRRGRRGGRGRSTGPLAAPGGHAEDGSDLSDVDAGDGGGDVSTGRGTRPGGSASRAGGSGGEPSVRSAGQDLEGEGEGTMEVALEEQAGAAAEFLEGLLAAFRLDATVTTAIDEDDERIEVRVDGDNLGILIGPKGATLLAIQDLTRTAVQVRTDARNGRLLVDVSGYRQKRAVALAGFVRQVAEQVRSTGRAVALEPMNAADRKVIHDTANQLEGIVTHSEGEEERRHVVLSPTSADS